MIAHLCWILAGSSLALSAKVLSQMLSGGAPDPRFGGESCRWGHLYAILMLLFFYQSLRNISFISISCPHAVPSGSLLWANLRQVVLLNADSLTSQVHGLQVLTFGFCLQLLQSINCRNTFGHTRFSGNQMQPASWTLRKKKTRDCAAEGHCIGKSGTGVTVPTSFGGINMKVFNRECHGCRFGAANSETTWETTGIHLTCFEEVRLHHA